MHTPIEFDYDLWTTEENGQKHYWARVKRTGEVTEISHDVMKFLRSEEKKIKRDLIDILETGTVLSLDYSHNDEFDSWFQDDLLRVSDMETPVLEKEFTALLTPAQTSVYEECLLHGKSVKEYADDHGISPRAVRFIIERIRKKAKLFF